MSAWLQWLNTAPIAEIEAELRAEEGPRADTSGVVLRCMRVIYQSRAKGEPFKRFEDFAGSRNVGKSSRRAMRNVLTRHGYEPTCRHCPVHCPGESDDP